MKGTRILSVTFRETVFINLANPTLIAGKALLGNETEK